MWCPSVSLSVWANAWLAGHAAPDDVLDARRCWGPMPFGDRLRRRRRPVAGSAMAGHGCRRGDVAVATVRTVARRSARRSVAARPAIAPTLPVPGTCADWRSAPSSPATPSTPGRLSWSAIRWCRRRSGAPVRMGGLRGRGGAPAPVVSWSVYSLPGVPVIDHPDLGDAEYALRAAVRSAAEALDGLATVRRRRGSPALVEETLQATSHHRTPDHAPPRAVRVLATAAHVDAILTVVREWRPSAPRARRRRSSPTRRCGRWPRWCARHGWPRSPRFCTRPGAVSGPDARGRPPQPQPQRRSPRSRRCRIAR